MKKLISEQMVNYLQRRGVEYVFGLCGHTVIAFLDALSRSSSVKYVSFRMNSLQLWQQTGMPESRKRPEW